MIVLIHLNEFVCELNAIKCSKINFKLLPNIINNRNGLLPYDDTFKFN
jgi:hypothetical protein